MIPQPVTPEIHHPHDVVDAEMGIADESGEGHLHPLARTPGFLKIERDHYVPGITVQEDDLFPTQEGVGYDVTTRQTLVPGVIAEMGPSLVIEKYFRQGAVIVIEVRKGKLPAGMQRQVFVKQDT
jgi:hypothetical protein